jgi:o-succinylbenzoate synthase
MKLARHDLYRYRLPFSRSLTLGGFTLHHREGLLLRLSGDDGSAGWGETAPLPSFSWESVDEAASQLCRLAGTMMGRGVTDDWVGPYGSSGRELGRVAPSVRFGFELAVWNLYASSSGSTLPEVVTSAPRPVVPVNGLLAGSSVDVLADARRMRDAGYRSKRIASASRQSSVLLTRAGSGRRHWWRWRPASETALFLPGWTPTGRWPKTFSRRR